MKHIYLYFVAIIIMILAILNSSLSNFFEVDVIKLIPYSPVIKIIYVFILLCTVYVAVNRDTYLPFLGQTVYPCGILTDKVPDQSTIEVTVRVPPKVKVVYWAAEHAKDMDVVRDPMTAYLNYENAGVTTANEQGVAVIKLREPSQYMIPTGRTLDKHVHYRYCSTPGMLSPIQTTYIP